MTRRAWFYLMPDTGRGGEFPFIYYDFPKRFRKEDDRPRYSCELPPDVVEIASSGWALWLYTRWGAIPFDLYIDRRPAR